MPVTKFVLACAAALSLIGCAGLEIPAEDRIMVACGEAEVRTGSMIVRRDRCVDKSPAAVAAARERAEEMRRSQNLEHPVKNAIP